MAAGLGASSAGSGPKGLAGRGENEVALAKGVGEPGGDPLRLIKIGLASVNTIVGATASNTGQVIAAAHQMADDKVTVGCFSEQVIGGYPPEDLIQWRGFVAEQRRQLERIASATQQLDTVLVVGLTGPVMAQDAPGQADFERGNELLKVGKFDQALEAYQGAVEAAPGNPQYAQRVAIVKQVLMVEKIAANESHPRWGQAVQMLHRFYLGNGLAERALPFDKKLHEREACIPFARC